MGSPFIRDLLDWLTDIPTIMAHVFLLCFFLQRHSSCPDNTCSVAFWRSVYYVIPQRQQDVHKNITQYVVLIAAVTECAGRWATNMDLKNSFYKPYQIHHKVLPVHTVQRINLTIQLLSIPELQMWLNMSHFCNNVKKPLPLIFQHLTTHCHYRYGSSSEPQHLFPDNNSIL